MLPRKKKVLVNNDTQISVITTRVGYEEDEVDGYDHDAIFAIIVMMIMVNLSWPCSVWFLLEVGHFLHFSRKVNISLL